MKNVLIIKPSSFGDVVQALPVAAHIRETWPGARISWLVNTQYKRLLEHNPCIDSMLLFQRHLWKAQRDLPSAVSSFTRLCRRLYAARFDAVLDLQGLFRSGFLTAVTGAPIRVGFANAREYAHLFYTRRVKVADPDMHAVERYLLAAEALGGKRGEVRFPLGIGDEEEAWAARLLVVGRSRRGAVIGLSPTARWKTKRLPYDSAARIGDILASKGAEVVIIGGLSGEGEEIVRRMQKKALAVDRITDPLRMAALLKRLDVVVTTDSGPMHLAAALGVPVVALFGPTNPSRTGPFPKGIPSGWGGAGHRVICAGVDCRPCYRRDCDRVPDCMSTFRPEAICEAVKEILARK
ncbi:MAG: glycosyltransferase family 9 protein [bacterium]